MIWKMGTNSSISRCSTPALLARGDAWRKSSWLLPSRMPLVSVGKTLLFPENTYTHVMPTSSKLIPRETHTCDDERYEYSCLQCNTLFRHWFYKNSPEQISLILSVKYNARTLNMRYLMQFGLLLVSELNNIPAVLRKCLARERNLSH